MQFRARLVPVIAALLCFGCSTQPKNQSPRASSKSKQARSRSKPIRQPAPAVPLSSPPSSNGPIPSAITGPFWNLAAEERAGEVGYEVYLDSVGTESDNEGSIWKKVLALPSDRDSGSMPLKSVNTPDLIDAVISGTAARDGSTVFMKWTGQSHVVSEPLRSVGRIEARAAAIESRDNPFSTVAISFRKKLPGSEGALWASLSGRGSWGIAYIGGMADNPFTEGLYESIVFKDEAKLNSEERALIVETLAKGSGGEPENVIDSSVKIILKEKASPGGMPWSLIYAAAEFSDGEGSGFIRASYLVALKRKDRPLRILAQDVVKSSYDSYPIRFRGGPILRDGRYFLDMDGRDGWHCRQAFMIRPDGEYESTEFKCEPSSC